MDEWYDLMRQACNAARMSPDRSTQVGAVLVPLAGLPAVGWNRFPTGVVNFSARWERPLKYEFVGHAEHNVVVDCAAHGVRSIGSTLVCQWAACARCAVTMIEGGVGRLVRHPSTFNMANTWLESVKIGDIMLREAGIEIIDYAPPEPYGIPLLRDGKVVIL